ncbi:hypothetical protein J2S00_000538 [Caldalkalibacillus uzonensis]|uniref:Uncharacterized protein n=1 Tax=Caldalkalibacillus uzonensis TaxID=353224 RepID=A0ABU0CMX2_9BACI|nr:hypothetical protein [Caldalkalibacillus uzonensis]MDQ0337768.1 hypothetical protein [Caldalkalibacillus uzonensis]
MSKDKVRVRITCEVCGEQFTLRGRKNVDDRYYGTGFKRCLCDNERRFSVRPELDP